MANNHFILQMLAKAAIGAFASFAVPSMGSGQSPQKPEMKARDAPSRLPKVPTVDNMIRPGKSIETTLSKTPDESMYDSKAVVNEARIRTTMNLAEGEEVETLWGAQDARWSPARFYTNPLYFEQINLERFEPKSPVWTRPALSYAQFIGTIPVLPYKIGAHLPRERMFKIGHYPEGKRVDRRSDPGNIRRGILFQSAAATGLIFVVP